MNFANVMCILIRLHIDNVEMAKQFANDFDGIRDGQNVTVFTKPSLEQIFMHYYGGESDD